MEELNYSNLETGTLTEDNLMTAITALKKQLVENPTYHPFEGLVIPVTVRGNLNYTKYRGKGRPRNEDYDRISTEELIKGNYVVI